MADEVGAAVAFRRIGPQPGPQTTFLASPADIAIYGGAAGGGKSFALLMEPLRHLKNELFGAVCFRRTLKQVRNEGGLWDEASKLYPDLGAQPVVSPDMAWRFPHPTDRRKDGASVSFGHLEYEKNKFDWQGAQIPLLLFDELTHFTATQFWYMVSRNRSTCGVRPYIRATCNPDADSWVAALIAWWIDPKTGYPIPERAGVLRWFVRVGDQIMWANSPQELAGYAAPNEHGVMTLIPPKSLTFIPAKLSDNKILMAADPAYMANLLALPTVERERLLGGNWKIRPAAGLYFQRSWCQVVDAAPTTNIRICRGWDLGATPKTESNDPDWTAGTKLGVTDDGRIFVMHHCRDRLAPFGVERMIKNTAEADGKGTMISLPQDPGQAGKSQIASLTKMLAGHNVRSSPESGDKITRFSPFSAQAEAGNVFVVRGNWNDTWFGELEAFPPPEGSTGHDDDADATSRAYNALLDKTFKYGMLGVVGT